MGNRPQEHYWQFNATDGADVLTDGGAAFFEHQARQLADTLGCRLVTYTDISPQRTDPGKWIVSGTVVLVK